MATLTGGARAAWERAGGKTPAIPYEGFGQMGGSVPPSPTSGLPTMSQMIEAATQSKTPGFQAPSPAMRLSGMGGGGGTEFLGMRSLEPPPAPMAPEMDALLRQQAIRTHGRDVVGLPGAGRPAPNFIIKGNVPAPLDLVESTRVRPVNPIPAEMEALSRARAAERVPGAFRPIGVLPEPPVEPDLTRMRSPRINPIAPDLEPIAQARAAERVPGAFRPAGVIPEAPDLTRMRGPAPPNTYLQNMYRGASPAMDLDSIYGGRAAPPPDPLAAMKMRAPSTAGAEAAGAAGRAARYSGYGGLPTFTEAVGVGARGAGSLARGAGAVARVANKAFVPVSAAMGAYDVLSDIADENSDLNKTIATGAAQVRDDWNRGNYLKAALEGVGTVGRGVAQEGLKLTGLPQLYEVGKELLGIQTPTPQDEAQARADAYTQQRFRRDMMGGVATYIPNDGTGRYLVGDQVKVAPTARPATAQQAGGLAAYLPQGVSLGQAQTIKAMQDKPFTLTDQMKLQMFQQLQRESAAVLNNPKATPEQRAKAQAEFDQRAISLLQPTLAPYLSQGLMSMGSAIVE